MSSNDNKENEILNHHEQQLVTQQTAAKMVPNVSSEVRLDLVGGLCEAALHGDIPMLQKLINQGADVNRDCIF